MYSSVGKDIEDKTENKYLQAGARELSFTGVRCQMLLDFDDCYVVVAELLLSAYEYFDDTYLPVPTTVAKNPVVVMLLVM